MMQHAAASRDCGPGSDMKITETRSIADLRALVRRYRVLWSILPKHLPESMNGARIGFDLELWGSHAHPEDAGQDECGKCSEVVEALSEVARRISPSICEFRTRGGNPVDLRASVYPRNGFGRTVRFGIEVVCRGGYAAVRTECDAGCFARMRETLLELGARRI